MFSENLVPKTISSDGVLLAVPVAPQNKPADNIHNFLDRPTFLGLSGAAVPGRFWGFPWVRAGIFKSDLLDSKSQPRRVWPICHTLHLGVGGQWLRDSLRRATGSRGRALTAPPKPYKFVKFGALHGPHPPNFIKFGDLHGPKSCKFMRFGDIHGPNFINLISLVTSMVPIVMK
jgi:hypothetical protein